MDAPEKNTPAFNLEEDHSLVINSLPALLDQQEPDVACVQDGSIESSKCDNNNLCTTKYNERNASNEQSLLPDLNQYEGLENETMSSQRKFELWSFTSSGTGSQGHRLPQVPASMEMHLGPSEIEVHAFEDITQSSVHIASEDFCQSTPKRKRKVHKSDVTGEGDYCRNCNCKKSKCLKLYCKCFSAGFYCAGPCSCEDCFNKPINEDTVLQTLRKIESRNPLAFVPKVITSSHSSAQIVYDPNKTPASKLHRRGCNCSCRKSSCMKNYCECFEGGVACSPSCKCQGCENIHGRKDSAAETKSKLEETKALQDGPKKAPASKRRRIRCKCMKSSCMNRYCECFKGGVACSPSCKCQGCKNIYGRKDGAAETKLELEETEALQVSSQNKELVESNAIRSYSRNSSSQSIPSPPSPNHHH